MRSHSNWSHAAMFGLMVMSVFFGSNSDKSCSRRFNGLMSRLLGSTFRQLRRALGELRRWSSRISVASTRYLALASMVVWWTSSTRTGSHQFSWIDTHS